MPRLKVLHGHVPRFGKVAAGGHHNPLLSAGERTKGGPEAQPALRYAEGLRTSADVAARQGCAVALGVLPRALLAPHAHAALAALAAATQVRTDAADRVFRAVGYQGRCTLHAQYCMDGLGASAAARARVSASWQHTEHRAARMRLYAEMRIRSSGVLRLRDLDMQKEESSVETRAAAASALAAVAQELYPARPPGAPPCACAQLQNGRAAGAIYLPLLR